MTARDDRGFTLPELLVAITILGIIIVAIGAMITTSFRTSAIVSAELQGSRAPKTVSRYWVPDVEQAEVVTPKTDGGCGTGGTAVASMTSHLAASAFDHPASGTSPGTPRTVTYRTENSGAREQLVRWVCDQGVGPTSLVVVSALDPGTPPTVTTDHASATITVTVPDNSRSNKLYTFSLTAASQITTSTS